MERSLKIAHEVKEALLNHVKPGVVGTYDQWEYIDEKREALSKWAKRLYEAVDGKAGGKVAAGPWQKRA
jgi:hypothetical protein